MSPLPRRHWPGQEREKEGEARRGEGQSPKKEKEETDLVTLGSQRYTQAKKTPTQEISRQSSAVSVYERENLSSSQRVKRQVSEASGQNSSSPSLSRQSHCTHWPNPPSSRESKISSPINAIPSAPCQAQSKAACLRGRKNHLILYCTHVLCVGSGRGDGGISELFRVIKDGVMKISDRWVSLSLRGKSMP